MYQLDFLYVSMAHNKHFTPHPDDILFHKLVNQQYEVLPSRKDAFSDRIKQIQKTY